MTAASRKPRHWQRLRTVSSWQLLLIASGWVTLVAVLILPASSMPRVILAFCFILGCPGAAIVGLLPMRDQLERFVLSIAISTALACLVTEALVIMRIRSTPLGLVPLALITTVAVFIRIYRSRHDFDAIPVPGEKARA